MSINNPTKAGNFKEIDAVQSTEWGLLCLSRQKFKLSFELLNMTTDRAHKLVFTGAGTDEITCPTEWTKGQYYQKFTTERRLNFDGFHEILAMLSPGNAPLRMNHIFRIGFLAQVSLDQSHGEFFGKWHMFGNCTVIYGNGRRSISPLFTRPAYAAGEYTLNFARIENLAPAPGDLEKSRSGASGGVWKTTNFQTRY